ncbi:MAG: amidohydrolase [Bacillota bacterium]
MILYKNCKVITLNDKCEAADTIVVENGKIVFAGLERDCPVEFLAKSEQVDLRGGTVVPGFWESHLHLVDGMRSLLELNLRSCNDYDSFISKFSEYKAGIQPGEYIIGHGWDENRIFSGRFPDRRLLDSICDTHPIILIRMDGHSLCVNTKAVELLELNRLEASTEAPFDADGMPTGMFYENSAIAIVDRLVKELPDSYIERLVLSAQELFVQNGITSINDICTRYGRYFDIYRRLQKLGKLKLRIVTSPYGSELESVEEFDARTGEETDRLKIGPPKYFIDGSFGSRTALLFEDYSDEQGNSGLQLIERDELINIIMDNEMLNKPINIHAIGDKAVSIVLDCIEASRSGNQRDIRSRIEHIQIVKNNDIERFKALDVTASFQPVFLYETELTRSRLGTDRINSVYRFRSFLDRGVNVVFNSDWPYGGGDMPYKPDNSRYIGFEPLLGMHAACCLQMNDCEAVSPMEALSCYTTNAAYVNYMEKELGKITEGCYADFVVLSNDISECDSNEIVNTKVLMTIINGEIVYCA